MSEDLEKRSTEAITAGPDLDPGVLAIRWHMVHARELRSIRKSLARLKAALADGQPSGARESGADDTIQRWAQS